MSLSYVDSSTKDLNLLVIEFSESGGWVEKIVFRNLITSEFWFSRKAIEKGKIILKNISLGNIRVVPVALAHGIYFSLLLSCLGKKFSRNTIKQI